MKRCDRVILGLLTAGIWTLVAVQLLGSAGAAETPLQTVFSQYLTTALNQAKAVANGCRVKGEIHGSQFDGQLFC